MLQLKKILFSNENREAIRFKPNCSHYFKENFLELYFIYYLRHLYCKPFIFFIFFIVKMLIKSIENFIMIIYHITLYRTKYIIFYVHNDSYSKQVK